MGTSQLLLLYAWIHWPVSGVYLEKFLPSKNDPYLYFFFLKVKLIVTLMFHNDVLLNVHLLPPAMVVKCYIFPMLGLFFLLDWSILYHFSVFHKLIVFAVFLVSQACIRIYGFCSMWPFYFSIISANYCNSPFLLLKMANETEVLL